MLALLPVALSPVLQGLASHLASPMGRACVLRCPPLGLCRCSRFTHPNRSETIDNTRYTRLLFDLPPDTGSAMVHGQCWPPTRPLHPLLPFPTPAPGAPVPRRPARLLAHLALGPCCSVPIPGLLSRLSSRIARNPGNHPLCSWPMSPWVVHSRFKDSRAPVAGVWVCRRFRGLLRCGLVRGHSPGH